MLEQSPFIAPLCETILLSGKLRPSHITREPDLPLQTVQVETTTWIGLEMKDIKVHCLLIILSEDTSSKEYLCQNNLKGSVIQIHSYLSVSISYSGGDIKMHGGTPYFHLNISSYTIPGNDTGLRQSGWKTA